MTTINSDLDKRLHQLIGDWIEEDVTTALTASVAVLSTHLNQWDDGRNDKFNGYWVYVTNYANSTKDRKIYDYVTSGGSCSVRGANFSVEASSTTMATCRFYKYSYTMGQRAINDAIREIGTDVLFREIDDRSLVTGNILPDGHFEDWASSSALTFYTGSADATLLQSSTAGYYRGARGTYGLKITAGTAGDQYAYIDSDSYPRLLDLMDREVNMAVWARASSTDDAFMDIVYTLAGATATISSTTGCTADVFTLLYKENQSIPDDITKVEVRFRVHTAAQNVYFDNARISGRSLQEYMLPEPLRDGEVLQVYVQSSGYSDYACDDLMPTSWDRIYGSTFPEDGTYKYLKLPALYSDNRQIRLIGTSPLSAATAYTDTVEIDGREVDLFTAYAAYCLFRNEEGVPSSEDTGRYQSRAMRYLREYERLKPSLRMVKPSGALNLQRKW